MSGLTQSQRMTLFATIREAARECGEERVRREDYIKSRRERYQQMLAL